MKVWPFVLSLCAVTALSLSARADHHEVFVQDVVRLDSSACAVELEIDAANQNGFEGVDRIEVDGALLAELGDAEAAAIDSGGNVNAGDTVLFASNGFMSETGLDADVVFDNSQCGVFVTGAEFSFVIDDPAFGGPDAVIDSVILLSGFGDNSAAFKSSEGASLDLRDLDNETVLVTNNAGDEVILGNDSGNNDNGGCQLGGSANPGLGAWSVAAGLSALALTRALRRRSS